VGIGVHHPARLQPAHVLDLVRCRPRGGAADRPGMKIAVW